MSFHIFCLLSNWIVYFLMLNLGSSLYILGTSSVFEMWFADIFSCSLSFYPLFRVFCETKVLILISTIYQHFLLRIVLLVSSLRILCLDLDLNDFFPTFALKVL